MTFLKKSKKIYVLCPAYVKTGGPELLHQLVFTLNKLHKKAYITYFDINDSTDNSLTNPDFKKYVTTYKVLRDIEDDSENIVIIPESMPAINYTKKIKKAKKVVWWLSVDNYTKYHGIIKPIKNFGLKSFLKLLAKRYIFFSYKNIKLADYHLCQSYYAIDFLLRTGINRNKIDFLSDYIGDNFLKIKETEWKQKHNTVAYNPKKGYAATKKIIKRMPNTKFVAIKNLTTKKVAELLLKSKVYIDFGRHPGKDRIPREAAMSGCCVITGKNGSANFEKDLPIPKKYKFHNHDLINITSCIQSCLLNYKESIQDYKEYREFILKEKKHFEDDVKRIFIG